jgi:hypothetical protein
MQQLRVHSRPGPFCYSRERMADRAEARVEAEGGSALTAVLSVVTCVALFVVVYGGWGY